MGYIFVSPFCDCGVTFSKFDYFGKIHPESLHTMYLASKGAASRAHRPCLAAGIHYSYLMKGD